MEITKNKLVLVWLCLGSAILTSIARILNATDMAWDFPSQIQAAQHLLGGKGLSIYAWAVEGDLAGRARLLTMAHFPAGFSLCAAGLLALGFSVAAIVKTYGAIATILGWWGWMELGVYFFGDGFKRSVLWRWVAYATAFVLPLMCTPPWQGTEIFFWAALPWVVRWVTWIPNEPTSSRPIDWIAGVLCGFAVLMNYAAVFLVLYTFFVIRAQSRISSKPVGRRIVSFAIGVLPFVALQLYINHFTSETESVAGSLTVAGGISTVLKRLWQGLGLLNSANLAIAWWVPHQLLNWFTKPNNAVLVAETMVVFALLPRLIASKLGYQRVVDGAGDVRVVAVGFFAIVPFCLWIWTGFSDYLFIADLKYYIPLIPLGVFIGYALAAPHTTRESTLGKFVQRIGVGYSITFVFLAAVSLVFLFLPGHSGEGKRAKLMGTTKFDHWPSMKLAYEFSAARAYAIDLIKRNPDTIVVTNHEEWFYGDPNVDGSRITRLKDFRATYITGPSHVLIVAEDFSGGPPEAVSWYTHFGELMRADFFQQVPNFRLVKAFPQENVKIVEAWIPAGERIPLPHNVHEENKT